MTDVVAVALIGLVAGVVGTVPAVMLALARLREIKTALAANTVTTVESAAKIGKVEETTAEIRTQGNGHLSRVLAERDVEREKVRGYELLLTEMRNSKTEARTLIDNAAAKQAGEDQANLQRDQFKVILG